MPADEQDLFEQEAIEETAAALAAQEEGPTREVHPESPELVTPESFAKANEEPEEEAEPVEEPVAEEPPAAAEPAATYPASPPPGYVPLAAVQAERARVQAERARAEQALSRVEELSAGLKQIQEHFAQQDAAKRAAEAASAIPAWEEDARGNLIGSIAKTVLDAVNPRFERVEGVIGKLDGLVGQTEEQQKAQATDIALRQAYTMQERAAMADPEANAAVHFFHLQRYQHHLNQGFDEATAGTMANEDRFTLYRGGGAQNGPQALVTMYRNLGMDPTYLWQLAQASAAQQQQAPAPAQPEVPAQVPTQAAKVPQRRQPPPGPRRIDEMPPPVRGRRPSEAESTAYNFIMHHFEEIVPNELDGYIQRVAEEQKISQERAYDKVLQGLKTRARTA